MTSNSHPVLCSFNNCRLLSGHKGQHHLYPLVWQFMQQKDKDKLTKAGFATPRGGAKGAYQNHVSRSNRVIVPYEKLRIAPVRQYFDGYVVRLLPEQYFASKGLPKDEFLANDYPIKIGKNAFILYRTHAQFQRFPPLEGWQVCHLEKDGQTVKERGKGVIDVGQYVLRIPALGSQKKRFEGVVQGVFAPEYTDQETNYLCKCVLAWLIIHTVGSPYTTTQAKHLQAILHYERLLDASNYEYKGMMRHGLCICPLCLRFVHYNELHSTVIFNDAVGNENAAEQIEGATRSTIVNLFHLVPLRYDAVLHSPSNVAWGHAVCNTRLGQRPCVSLAELIEMDRKVGIIKPEGIETFGWMSSDDQMIRSPHGAVWAQLNGDMDGHEGTPPEQENEAMSLEVEEEAIIQIQETEQEL